jgi:glycosyltransferase involved in cell wall biosynthesis
MGYSMSNITVVLTSCRRQDLLVQTLDSFFGTNDYPIKEFIVIEGSNDQTVAELASRYPDQPLRFIINGNNLGQHRSIDKAYAEVTTPYILHLEDDWLFPVPGVIAKGIAILEQEPKCHLVQLRDHEDMPKEVRRITPKQLGDARYSMIPPATHRVWHSFTYNPTVKRLADCKSLEAGYAGFTTEAEISLFYKNQGREMAWLLDAGIKHIGWDRSNFGHRGGLTPKAMLSSAKRFFSIKTLAKWQRSVDRRIAHSRRKRAAR